MALSLSLSLLRPSLLPPIYGLNDSLANTKKQGIGFLKSLPGFPKRLPGKSGRLFGKLGRLFGKQGRLFGKQVRLFGRQGRLLGKSGRLFEKQGRLLGKPTLFVQITKISCLLVTWDDDLNIFRSYLRSMFNDEFRFVLRGWTRIQSISNRNRNPVVIFNLYLYKSIFAYFCAFVPDPDYGCWNRIRIR